MELRKYLKCLQGLRKYSWDIKLHKQKKLSSRIKGTVSVISSDPSCKYGTVLFQYVFLYRRNSQVTFIQKSQIENNQFSK